MALLVLAVILPLMLQCRGIGGYRSIIYSREKLATPPTTLSERDYPFDAKGRYRTDWVKSGSTRKRSKSSFHTVSTSPPKSQTTISQSPPKTSSRSPSKTKKSSSRITVASNTTQPSKKKPPPVYTPKPAPPKPTPPPTPQKKQARYHTIAKGDTLWDISRRYKVTISAVKSANGLTSDLIRPGQTLRIP